MCIEWTVNPTPPRLELPHDEDAQPEGSVNPRAMCQSVSINYIYIRWCPPSYKLVYNPINYRYITYKP
jgi:hypothetical protein